MSTEVKEQTDVVEEKQGKPAISAKDFALVFELENLAVSTRRATFDLLKSILGEQKIDFTAPVFSRYCIYSSPGEYIPELLDILDVKKTSSEKLVEDLSNGLAMYLSSKQATLQAGLEPIIKETVKAGVPVATLSLLSEDAATSLMSKLGLGDLGVQLFAFADDQQEVFPRADTWMKVAKSMSKDPRRCVALASSAASCKAALSAGMRCIAVPDAFTAFQDFGGAEMVLDSLEDCDASELAAELFRFDDN